MIKEEQKFCLLISINMSFFEHETGDDMGDQSNEQGFALVITLIIMVLLSIMGISATNTAIFELDIAGNERGAAELFYTADSGWKQGGTFLNARATPPKNINLTRRPTDNTRDWTNEYYQIVRNYGDGGDGIVNDAFTANEDGKIGNHPYWYRVIYKGNTPAVMFGSNYRDFAYAIQCTAAGSTEVDTRVKKVFKVGY